MFLVLGVRNFYSLGRFLRLFRSCLLGSLGRSSILHDRNVSDFHEIYRPSGLVTLYYEIKSNFYFDFRIIFSYIINSILKFSLASIDITFIRILKIMNLGTRKIRLYDYPGHFCCDFKFFLVVYRFVLI